MNIEQRITFLARHVHYLEYLEEVYLTMMTRVPGASLVNIMKLLYFAFQRKRKGFLLMCGKMEKSDKM